MNYRHAYHAGNFADVMKHAVLARILTYLVQKPAALRYIDTHAGIGWYDIADDRAERTGEWRTGIGRLDTAAIPDAIAPLLQPYLEAVGSRDSDGRPYIYPGSPGIAQSILRPADRLLLSEMHPEDGRLLRAAMKGDKRVRILAQDGYLTLNASVPPAERRGLVLIDPPFEQRTEVEAMANAFAAAFRKWPTGIYMLWYPIKAAEPIAALLRRLREIAGPRGLELELADQRNASGEGGLRGSGLFIANPPYTLAAEAALLLPFLAGALEEPSRQWSCRIAEGA